MAGEVAASLDAPLDVFVVRKLPTPGQPELALGAVASGGTVVLNDEIVRHLLLDRARIDRIIDEQRAIVDERERAYRGDRVPLALDGKTVVVVDDGLATGATMRAAIGALRQQRVAAVIAAAPVAPTDVVSLLSAEADRVVVVETPEHFVAVGSWYDDFRQTSDDEERDLLTRHR